MDMNKEATAHVPPGRIYAAVARIIDHMQEIPADAVPVYGFRVLDDRGGNGVYQLRVPGMKSAELTRILGMRGIQITMEHEV